MPKGRERLGLRFLREEGINISYGSYEIKREEKERNQTYRNGKKLRFGYGKKDKSQYCDRCCAFKPPRTHHCRICRRCVLKMDHHCSWIGNCVGYANYKSFIGCIFYGTVASIYSTVLSGLALTLLTITISSLFAWHIYLLSKNLTTIEYREAARAAWLAKKSGQNYRHPFDLGVYTNLKSNLGSNLLKWFIPLAVGHVRDGTQFPISND